MMESEKGPKYPLLPLIRQETIGMGRLSTFGQEIAIAKLRNTNPELYEYLEGLASDHTMVESTAPFYNVILLEHELRGIEMPRVIKEIVEKYQPLASAEELKEWVEELEKEQPYLANLVSNYIQYMIDRDKSVLAETTLFAISDIYELLKRAASQV